MTATDDNKEKIKKNLVATSVYAYINQDYCL